MKERLCRSFYEAKSASVEFVEGFPRVKKDGWFEDALLVYRRDLHHRTKTGWGIFARASTHRSHPPALYFVLSKTQQRPQLNWLAGWLVAAIDLLPNGLYILYPVIVNPGPSRAENRSSVHPE